MFSSRIRRIHFVGIGGSGMSGIAEVLLTMGYQVTGSDMKEGAVIERLRELGGAVFIGHNAENVAGADVVVKSTAISNSNAEIVAAQSDGIPIIPRAEMLAELMRVKYGIAIAGTHGKTTTTSMVATILHRADLDPTVVIGGRLDAMGSSARMGSGAFMVAEADESDGSFMLLSPSIAVVTNIDPEHMNHWGSYKALVDGFFDFANKVPFFGAAVLCIDHPTVRIIEPWLRRRAISYGLSPDADVRGEKVRYDGLTTSFTAVWRGNRLGEIRLGMPGEHNVRNALAAVAVGLELDIPFEKIQRALHNFTGVDRRFSIRAEVQPAGGGAPVTIVDDYGHHPVEIQATLGGARGAWPDRRILAVFQPHRYSRVADLLSEFCASFGHADHVVVCPIYAAGEKPLPRITHERIQEGLQAAGVGSSAAVDSLEEATDHLAALIQPGDVVITLGAGNVNSVCASLALRLSGQERAGDAPAEPAEAASA